MDKLDWGKIADVLKRVFKCKLTCDIYRTQKTKDEIGGDIERMIILHKDVPCYASRHPKSDVDITESPIGVRKDAHWRLHFHPDVDVRDGDILIVHGKQERQFLVTRVADYYGHTRIETSIWDKQL